MLLIPFQKNNKINPIISTQSFAAVLHSNTTKAYNYKRRMQRCVLLPFDLHWRERKNTRVVSQISSWEADKNTSVINWKALVKSFFSLLFETFPLMMFPMQFALQKSSNCAGCGGNRFFPMWTGHFSIRHLLLLFNCWQMPGDQSKCKHQKCKVETEPNCVN